MATSQYFNLYNSKYSDQRVIEDLIVESIKIMGFDAYYLPNDNDAARDLLFGEDPVKKFQTAFPLEMYLSSATEYGGEREFFSKFGLEIKNNVNVILSKRTFGERTPGHLIRPREGDLVYVPFLNGQGELFEIKFVNHTKDFFQLGRKYPYFYELELEKFKYSHELIDTGIPDIDVVATDNSYTLSFNLGVGAGTYTLKEIVYQSPNNIANATASAILQTYDTANKVITVTNITGEFIDGHPIIGELSNASYTLTTYEPLADNVSHDSYQNLYIEQQGNSITDFSESNPFGQI